MDIFHLCRYLTYNFLYCLYSLTQHTYCKVFSYSHPCTVKCLQQGMVDIEHIYWDDTILLKMTHIITFWRSALLCSTCCMIHPQWLLAPPNKHNAGNKNNSYHLVTYQDMLPSIPSLPLTLHAKFWYSVLFLSPPCRKSNIHKRTTKNSTRC